MIRMSKLADYSLVLMTRLVASKGGSNLSARQLATKTRLPLPVVSKVLKALAREGLLVSHRGASGGYSLSRQPERISVAQILSAVEGPIAMTECLDESAECRQEAFCPVRTNWERINFAVNDVLDSITLTDMMKPLPERLVTLSRRELDTTARE
jgi:FeS assembly SUF system regulator